MLFVTNLYRYQFMLSLRCRADVTVGFTVRVCCRKYYTQMQKGVYKKMRYGFYSFIFHAMLFQQVSGAGIPAGV